MNDRKEVALETSKLTLASKLFCQELLTAKPEWKQFCKMESSKGGYTLLVKIPSPTKDVRREIAIYFDSEDEEFNVSFCRWYERASRLHFEQKKFTIIECVENILAGKLVAKFNEPAFEGFSDLVIKETISEICNSLASKNWSGIVKFISWSGAQDKEVRVRGLV